MSPCCELATSFARLQSKQSRLMQGGIPAQASIASLQSGGVCMSPCCKLATSFASLQSKQSRLMQGGIPAQASIARLQSGHPCINLYYKPTIKVKARRVAENVTSLYCKLVSVQQWYNDLLVLSNHFNSYSTLKKFKMQVSLHLPVLWKFEIWQLNNLT